MVVGLIQIEFDLEMNDRTQSYIVACACADIAFSIAVSACDICEGCIIDHGSQCQHNICIGLSWPQKVERFFAIGFKKVNIDRIYHQLTQRFNFLDDFSTTYGCCEGNEIAYGCYCLRMYLQNVKHCIYLRLRFGESGMSRSR